MVMPFCGEGDPRKYVRLAALLRSQINDGTLKPADIAGHYRNVPKAALKALSVLKDEQLVTWHRYKW